MSICFSSTYIKTGMIQRRLACPRTKTTCKFMKHFTHTHTHTLNQLHNTLLHIMKKNPDTFLEAYAYAQDLQI